MLYYMLSQHSPLIAYSNINIGDMLPYFINTYCDQSASVVRHHSLRNNVRQGHQSHAPACSHNNCIIDHRVHTSSIGGILIMASISASDSLSVLAEDKPKDTGLATFSLNEIR